MICELLFPSSIQAVKMNRKTLVIVLETEIYIYDISNMRLLHVIETMPNPEGEPSPSRSLHLLKQLQQYLHSLPTPTTHTSPIRHPSLHRSQPSRQPPPVVVHLHLDPLQLHPPAQPPPRPLTTRLQPPLPALPPPQPPRPNLAMS